MPSGPLTVTPIIGIPRVKLGDDLARLILRAMTKNGISLLNGDIIVVTQKVVSKAEGRMTKLRRVKPSKRAVLLAEEMGKDPRLMEVILRESRRIVRKGHGVLITETKHGFVCANSGVDQSNVRAGTVSLLPEKPDVTAKKIRTALERATGKSLAVIITDTFGRPWREGQVDVAVGSSGIRPVRSLIGRTDPYGYTLKVTEPAVVDEVAAASELVMNKLSLIPVALIRGLRYKKSEDGVDKMLRDAKMDLFR